MVLTCSQENVERFLITRSRIKKICIFGSYGSIYQKGQKPLLLSLIPLLFETNRPHDDISVICEFVFVQISINTKGCRLNSLGRFVINSCDFQSRNDLHHSSVLPPGLSMRLKVLIFRGNALIYIKETHIFHWPTFSPPHSLPQVHVSCTEELYRPLPACASRAGPLHPRRVVEEVEGLHQVKHPPWTPQRTSVPQSDVMQVEFTMNVVTENDQRPVHTRETD